VEQSIQGITVILRAPSGIKNLRSNQTRALNPPGREAH